MAILRTIRLAALLAVVAVAGVACSAEQQNQLRRDVLNLANAPHYIVVYALDGREIFRGELNGKVTRAEANGAGTGGEYIYWFDRNGRYWQTNMPYLVTTDPNRTGILTQPVKP